MLAVVPLPEPLLPELPPPELPLPVEVPVPVDVLVPVVPVAVDELLLVCELVLGSEEEPWLQAASVRASSIAVRTRPGRCARVEPIMLLPFGIAETNSGWRALID